MKLRDAFFGGVLVAASAGCDDPNQTFEFGPDHVVNIAHQYRLPVNLVQQYQEETGKTFLLNTDGLQIEGEGENAVYIVKSNIPLSEIDLTAKLMNCLAKGALTFIRFDEEVSVPPDTSTILWAGAGWTSALENSGTEGQTVTRGGRFYSFVLATGSDGIRYSGDDQVHTLAHEMFHPFGNVALDNLLKKGGSEETILEGYGLTREKHDPPGSNYVMTASGNDPILSISPEYANLIADGLHWNWDDERLAHYRAAEEKCGFIADELRGLRENNN